MKYDNEENERYMKTLNKKIRPQIGQTGIRFNKTNP